MEQHLAHLEKRKSKISFNKTPGRWAESLQRLPADGSRSSRPTAGGGCGGGNQDMAQRRAGRAAARSFPRSSRLSDSSTTPGAGDSIAPGVRQGAWDKEETCASKPARPRTVCSSGVQEMQHCRLSTAPSALYYCM